MLKRLRSMWLAGGGAIVLTLSISGIAAGAVLVARNVDRAVEPVGTTETTETFEDLDGNGVDDDCQDAAAKLDPDAALAALTAADLDRDGTISVSEAARSGWVGGKNCNHGGYVSSVARDSDDPEDDADADAGADPAECEAPVVEPAVVEETPVDTAPNAHGKAVSKVAKSDAVGGKNCNHGGAVSEAAKKDHADKHGDAAKKDHADKGQGKGQGKDQAKGHGKP